MSRNMIDKAKEIANDISKKTRRTFRRGKVAIKKGVDNYLEKLSQHIQEGDNRVIESEDKVPSSLNGRIKLSKHPNNAKNGTKL